MNSLKISDYQMVQMKKRDSDATNERVNTFLVDKPAKDLFTYPNAPHMITKSEVRYGMKNQIVVNLTTLRCSYFENGKLVKEYPVGIGKPLTPTPPGNYQIVDKLVFEAMGDIDFGSRRLILSSEKTCLHGSWHGPVEGHVSGGCVRMYNKDIEELFPHVEIGTSVVMISQ